MSNDCCETRLGQGSSTAQTLVSHKLSNVQRRSYSEAEHQIRLAALSTGKSTSEERVVGEHEPDDGYIDKDGDVFF